MMRTLVAEDDFTSRVLLQEILSAYGAVDLAENGQEAVEAVGQAFEQGSPYDLICLDIMMPVFDGKEALKRIRAIEEHYSVPGAKVFMTTALEDPNNVIDAFMDNCDAYLVKPIRKADLLEHLRAFELIN